MADPALAGDEDHPGRRDPGHEQRIVIGAADHGQAVACPVSSHAASIAATTPLAMPAGGSELRQSTTAATCRRAAIVVDGSLNRGEDVIAAGEVDVADVDLENDPVGNAVDRTGVDPADARGRDGVGAAARSRGRLDRQHRFGGRAQGIASAPASTPRRRARPRPPR